jgi:hypothetical protein
MSPRRPWAVLLLLLALPSFAGAATLRVPGDFPLIQSAIDAAASGDIVQVGPGTYDENLVVAGKSVSLVATAGADATIVDGGRRGRVLLLAGGVVDGFTLRNGYAADGAGIHLGCDGPTTVRNCVVRDNEAMTTGGVDPDGWGGGIYIAGGNTEDVVVEGNVITANNSGGQGGGICCEIYFEGGEIRDNLISGNGALYHGGGVYMNGGVLLRNRIVGNLAVVSGGGGVTVAYGECRSNTIVANSAPHGGGVENQGGTVTRNLVVGNRRMYSSGGEGIAGDCAGVTCNDSWGNEGGDFALGTCDTTGAHDFSADPLFCGSDDYHVSTGSPCLGLGACGLIGALPPACGVTAVRRTTWGAIKSAYR